MSENLYTAVDEEFLLLIMNGYQSSARFQAALTGLCLRESILRGLETTA